ncbi:30S ribosomal protein S21 [Patescibacteria group bacterium]|nr:30S ribosomal protein S21 [Patescibacteria group bacterium]
MAIVVKRKKGESKDDIIGKFRRLCIEEDITEEVRKRTAYAKPSIGRYEKKKVILWREKCRKKAKNSRKYVA